MEIIFSKKFIDILSTKCTEIYGDTKGLINPETYGLVLDNPPSDLAEIVSKIFSSSVEFISTDMGPVVATILVLKNKPDGKSVENLD